MDKVKFAKQFTEAIPHASAIGMKLDEIGDGWATMSLPYREELVGIPESGVIHSGAITAVVDTCCGAAVMSHHSAPGGTATIDLRMDYMRPATPGQTIVARAECYHITKSVAFVRAVATDDDTHRPVATATAAFSVEKSF